MSRILFYTDYGVIGTVTEKEYGLRKSAVMMLSLIILIVAVFSIQPDCSAEAPETLSWEDCIREATANNPDVRSSMEAVRQAEALRSIISSDRWPQVNSELDIRRAEQDPGEPADSYSYGLSATQLLFDGFKISYDVRAADEEVRSAEYELRVISADVRFRLRSAFVELMRAQEFVKITEAIVERRKQNADLVKLRYEAGREHRGSLLTLEANLAQAQFEAAQSLRNVRVAQRRLLKEIGRKQLTEVRAEGDFGAQSELVERPAIEEIAERSPVVLERKARKESARYSLKAARVDFVPEIGVNAHVGKADDTWPPENDEWSAGISVSFPLFEGGRRIAEVSRATAALGQAEADEQSSRDTVIVSLEETWTNYTDAVGNALVQLKFLEAARERAEIARAQYGSGLISFDNWTIIEDDLVRVEKTFLEAKANVLIAQAAWFQAQGRTLEDE